MPEFTVQQGLEIDVADPVVLRQAIEHAFHYRGDVTIDCEDRAEPLVGYVFDRRVGDTLESSTVRVIPADGGDRATVGYDRIRRLAFTGRDTAAGKSFETWMRKYVEKKLAGEEASVYSEEDAGDEPVKGR